MGLWLTSPRCIVLMYLLVQQNPVYELVAQGNFFGMWSDDGYDLLPPMGFDERSAMTRYVSVVHLPCLVGITYLRQAKCFMMESRPTGTLPVVSFLVP
jgi:hypothetical protein